MSEPRQPREKAYLLIALHQAVKSGAAECDPVLHAQRLQRFAELDQEDWARMIARLPELAPYQTVTEGMLHTADVLHLPLPPIEARTLEPLGGPRGGFSYPKAGATFHITLPRVPRPRQCLPAQAIDR